MSKPLLALCSIPKIAMRDGYAGSYANIILPFYTYGLWFASGQQYAFPAATVAQQESLGVTGTRKPDTFQKDCCSCISGA